MIRLLPRDAREINVLMGIRDGQGNTPLHLCCGNLEYREGGGDFCLAALKEIVKVAPTKAWSMQNFEGDTPLHMLVTSQLCSADLSSSFNGITNNSTSPLLSSASKLALEAVDLALFCGTESLTVRERTGATPLHVALAHGAHACVIEALLDAAPTAVMVEDARGMLPLHWAAAFGRASVNVVKRLIDEHPHALVHPTIDGDIPLHLIVANSMIEEEDGKRRDSSGAGGIAGGVDNNKVDKSRLKMVELLLQDPGRAVTSRDGDMMTPILTTNREKLTPLHCCALFDAPPQISKLLMKHPDANAASAMTNSFGATPLHLAAAQPGVSQSIATVLAIGTPDAASVQDRLKRTPLHVAAQNTYATNLLIKTLAELNPGAAAVKTQRGHLPLHLAAQSQAKEPVIRALIKAYPAAAEARNKSNNTPLHDAAKYRASLGVVKLLLDAYPGALYVQNQYGNLPLHCATAYQAPSEVVQLLLEVSGDIAL
jgi:ankyrin repeat protein